MFSLNQPVSFALDRAYTPAEDTVSEDPPVAALQSSTPGGWAGVYGPRTAARFILFAWAAFWVWFGLASGLSRHLPPLGLTLHVATPALIFALIAVLASRHERLAGWLLIAIALAILFEYNELMGHRGAFFVLQAGSILSGPPMTAGSLYLWAAREKDSIQA